MSLISQEWRINVGTTFSRLATWENDYKSDYRTGFQLGAMFEKELLDFSSFETGLELVSKGMKFDNISESYSLDYSVLYFDMPFLLNLKAEIFDKITAYSKGGFYASWGLSGKEIAKSKNNEFNYTIEKKLIGEKIY